MSRERVLLVEDDPGIRFGLSELLDSAGYDVDQAQSCETAVAAFGASRADVAVLDYSLPDGTALELIPRLRALDGTTPFIVLTGHGSIDLAVAAIKEGAEHFLTKPVEPPALLVILERTLTKARERRRQQAGRSRETRRLVDPFLGRSPAIRQLAEEAQRIRSADSPVLIQGETGSGKGVLAAWLSRGGPRAEEAFVDLNCATLGRELLESELFGHEKGAFTGAVAAKQGLLEVAHRGTLFLDEIGDMDATVQPKLLKVLEEKRFRRVGEVRERTVDVRLIAATHQDLLGLVQEKRFRSDLYFRISTIPLLVPPLRERREDIELLARDLVMRIAADLGRPDVSIDAAALEALHGYAWPGNVRELRNVLERAVLLCEARTVTRRDLRFATSGSEPVAAASGASDLALTLEQVEKRHIELVLKDERGHIDSAARRLDVPRSTLYKRLRALGILVPRT